MTFMPTLMAQLMPMTPQTIDRQVQNLVLEQRPGTVENVGDSERRRRGAGAAVARGSNADWGGA